MNSEGESEVERLTGELESGLLDTTLALEVIALLRPVGRDGDGVAVGFDLDEEFGIGCRNVDPIDDLWLADESLELGDGETGELALLALGDLWRFLVVVFGGHVVVGVDDLSLAGDGVLGLSLGVASQLA